MEKYIPKAALVVEILRRKKYYENIQMIKPVYESNIEDFNELISFLDAIEAIEVKEVDLEKEINKYISDNFFGSQTLGFFANRTKEEPNDEDIALVAKYFFELGLGVQKEEEV